MRTSVGIDVGSSKLFAVAIKHEGPDVVGISTCSATDPNEVEAWVADQDADDIAIDSPPAPNARLLASDEYRKQRGISHAIENTNRRVAECQLGIGGCYSTRDAKEDCPAWMQAGMQLHERLSGESGPDLSGKGRVFEVHPTFGFKSMLGLDKVGSRFICDPQRLLKPKRPTGSGGHAQRVRLLEAALQPQQSALQVFELCRRSIDITDAVCAAYLGVLRARGAVSYVGDPSEGVIVVAEPARALIDVVRQGEPAASRETTSRPQDRAADGAVLRLGANGPGGLSPQDTIDTLLGQLTSEGDAILPMDVEIGKDHQRTAQDYGLWVLLANRGVLSVAMRVRRFFFDNLEKADLGDRDIWPGVSRSKAWAQGDQVLDIREQVVGLDSLWFNKDGEWSATVSRNQGGWRLFRYPSDGPGLELRRLFEPGEPRD